MAEKRKYYIRLQGRSVEVARDVYTAYYRMARRGRYLEERDLTHGKVLYSQLDSSETIGEDMIPDCDAIPVDEVVETILAVEKLQKCVAMLREAERELIDALFFSNGGDGMTEREYSMQSGIPQQTVNDRRQKILLKLRKMMEQ